MESSKLGCFSELIIIINKSDVSTDRLIKMAFQLIWSEKRLASKLKFKAKKFFSHVN